jgi:acyl-CoA oxidase
MGRTNNPKNSAVQRLEQIKSQLNLSPSQMSLDAPKDMALERSAASFDIQALANLWAGGADSYERKVNIKIEY